MRIVTTRKRRAEVQRRAKHISFEDAQAAAERFLGAKKLCRDPHGCARIGTFNPLCVFCDANFRHVIALEMDAENE